MSLGCVSACDGMCTNNMVHMGHGLVFPSTSWSHRVSRRKCVVMSTAFIIGAPNNNGIPIPILVGGFKLGFYFP